MGRDMPLPMDGCWQLLAKKGSKKVSELSCLDREFLAFASWVRNLESPQKEDHKERFLRLYQFAELDQLIAGLNFQNGLAWDTDVSIPAEPRLVELALALPEYKNFRQAAEIFLKKF
jgi:hypothetical protein